MGKLHVEICGSQGGGCPIPSVSELLEVVSIIRGSVPFEGGGQPMGLRLVPAQIDALARMFRQELPAENPVRVCVFRERTRQRHLATGFAHRQRIVCDRIPLEALDETDRIARQNRRTPVLGRGQRDAVWRGQRGARTQSELVQDQFRSDHQELVRFERRPDDLAQHHHPDLSQNTRHAAIAPSR